MSWFNAGVDGIEVSLDPAEIAIMSGLTTLLGSAGAESGDPARELLDPMLYPDDEFASREFVRLTAKESADFRSTDREVFADSVRVPGSGTIWLTGDDAASWARVLAEARLVLAARRGLFSTGLPDEEPTDPEVALITLLGAFQQELVVQMTELMEQSE